MNAEFRPAIRFDPGDNDPAAFPFDGGGHPVRRFRRHGAVPPSSGTKTAVMRTGETPPPSILDSARHIVTAADVVTFVAARPLDTRRTAIAWAGLREVDPRLPTESGLRKFVDLALVDNYPDPPRPSPQPPAHARATLEKMPDALKKSSDDVPDDVDKQREVLNKTLGVSDPNRRVDQIAQGATMAFLLAKLRADSPDTSTTELYKQALLLMEQNPSVVEPMTKHVASARVSPSAPPTVLDEGPTEREKLVPEVLAALKSHPDQAAEFHRIVITPGFPQTRELPVKDTSEPDPVIQQGKHVAKTIYTRIDSQLGVTIP